ncbi:hypothetical protein IWQ62_001681 [Dispira parvispora]|uniref:Altered inheritance of mitochondria protein 24, mitochondrial n=1 Tax=Dispira parvispora TaxID=1520584 RepID=A0A9W8AXA7_9FUNG|nr:hypothetical protein IWQ62_001681 [Dispira parvispora]
MRFLHGYGLGHKYPLVTSLRRIPPNRWISLAVGDAGQSKKSTPTLQTQPLPTTTDAPNSTTAPITSNGTASSPDPAQVIRQWAVGLHSVLPQDKRPPPGEPRLEVVSSGHGAMVHATLPPYSVLYTVPGTVIGQSVAVTKQRTTRENIVTATSKAVGLGARLFYDKLATKRTNGDALLAAPAQGDVAVLELNGATSYVVQPTALSALTAGTHLTVAPGTSTDVLGRPRLHVSGRGAFVIGVTGGIHQIVLAAGEEYRVNPNYLVAWDDALTLTKPTPDTSSQPPASTAVSQQRGIPTLYQRALRRLLSRDTLIPQSVQQRLHQWVSPLRPLGTGVTSIIRLLYQRFFKSQDLWLVRGPGDFYIATRQPARFLSPVTRFSNSKSAEQ